jgi:hypothetical protein
MNRSLLNIAPQAPVFQSAPNTPAVASYATRRVLWSWGFGWSRTSPEPEAEERGARRRTRGKGQGGQKRK